MKRRSASIGALLGLLLVASSGCATREVRPPRIDEAESRDPAPAPAMAPALTPAKVEAAAVTLLPAGAFPRDVMMRQRVTVRWAEREESFEAVLQKQAGELVLLGLGPMNSVGFRLTLRGQEVDFENRTGRPLPFAPAHILADVQRAFYPWIEASSDCLACERRGLRQGLEVWERIGADRLEERRFSLPGQPERGEVVIRYAGRTVGRGEASAAARVTLDNAWFGYGLSIETWEVQSLE